MNKKTSLFCAFAFLAAALNAFDFAPAPLADKAGETLANIKAAQTKTPSYLLEPIYFTVSQSSSAAAQTPAECYAVVLNYKWLLTYQSCVNPSAKKGGDKFTINFNGAKYSAVFSGNKEALDYDTDSQTGAVVLNMRKIVITKQGGAITFADFIAKNNGGRFAKKSNYATILLMSVTAKELNDYYFKRAINNGTFSSPSVKTPFKIKSMDGFNLSADTDDTNSLQGEPLYMIYKTGNKIMVGVNAAKNGEPRKYVIFGVGMTRMMHFTMWNTAAGMIIVSDLADIILPFPPSM
jgi:hypothetical protein